MIAVFECAITMIALIYELLFFQQISGGITYGKAGNGKALGSRIAEISSKMGFDRYHGVYVILIVIVAVLFGMLLTKKLNRIISKAKYKTLMFLHALFYGVIFVSYGGFTSNYNNYGFNGINLSFLNQGIIFLVELTGICLIPYCYNNLKILQKYRKKSIVASWIAASIYIVFAFVGRSLFFDEKKTWICDEITVLIFVMMVIWIQPYIAGILVFCERYSLSVKVEHDKNIIPEKKLNQTIFFISCGIGLLWLIACYPGNFPPDAIDAWGEIEGVSSLSTAFPVMIKIIYRVIYHFIPNPVIAPIIQIILSALMLSTVGEYFHGKGFSAKKIVILCLIFMVVPTNGIFIVTFTSNFYYTISIVWMTYILIRYNENKEYLTKNICNCLLLGLSVLSVFYTRNEGKYVAIAMTLILLVVIIVRHSWRMIISLVVPILGICFVEGVLMNTMNVTNNISAGSTIESDIIWAVGYYNGNLGDLSVDKEKCSNSYDEYDCNLEADNGLPIMSAKELSKAFIDCAKDNPGIFIRERLNKTDCVWNVTEGAGAHNVREITFVANNKLGIIQNENILTKILVKILYPITIAVCVFDIFLYRSGIWIVLSLILLLFMAAHHRRDHVLELLPAYGHAGILMLSLLFQCSRHVYCIQLSIFLVIISELLQCDNEIDPKEKS